MKRLIYIEWLKISRNRVFWFTLAAYVLTITLVLIGLRQAIISANNNASEVTGGLRILPTEIYRFPHVWHNLTFIGKYVKIFIGILMILLVTNEFYYNTLRQNIINGLSKMEFVWSKFIDGVILSLFATVLIFIFGLVSGLINTSNLSLEAVFSQIEFIPGYFLMLIGYLTFVMMLSFLLRKAILAMGVLMVESYILEPILAWKFDDSFAPFLPMQSFNGMIIAPDTILFRLFKMETASNGIDPMNLAMTIGYTVLFFGITYWLLKIRDL